MKKALMAILAIVALAFSVTATTQTIDVGAPGDGLSTPDWSVANIPGGYGAGDPDKDGTYRMIWEGPCSDNERPATFTMNVPAGEYATFLTISALDGCSGLDAFDVYMNGNYIGSWSGKTSPVSCGGYPNEDWVAVSFDLGSVQEELNFELRAKNSAWASCATYGQDAVQWIALTSYPELDFWNIGDSISDAAHPNSLWSNSWNWGGNYGGGDDGTLRLLYGPGDGCTSSDSDAYFTMHAGTGTAYAIELRHLDGIKDDSYELFVNTGTSQTPVWTSIGTYSDVGNSQEVWYTNSYNLPTGMTGDIEFKLVATGTLDSSFCPTYGQVAFSWARLEGTGYGGQEEPPIPEFSAIAAGLALAGAATGFILLRRRK